MPLMRLGNFCRIVSLLFRDIGDPFQQDPFRRRRGIGAWLRACSASPRPDAPAIHRHQLMRRRAALGRHRRPGFVQPSVLDGIKRRTPSQLIRVENGS